MSYYITTDGLLLSEDSLAHYGITGMKWRLRRFQNYDGTLTPAGKERYHRMIATNVQKDRIRQQRALDSGSTSSFSERMRTRNRRNVERDIKKEFDKTAEGKRLAKANANVAKVQESMNERQKAKYEADAEGGSLLVDAMNFVGNKRDTNRMSKALAEQNEAQKDAAKTYDRLLREHKSEILDATIKDLKIYDIADGRKFLEKYLRGDDDATFRKIPWRQEWAEARAAAKDRKEGRMKAQSAADSRLPSREGMKWKVEKHSPSDAPEYIDKVKTASGETRYFYDEDELEAYKRHKNWSN